MERTEAIENHKKRRVQVPLTKEVIDALKDHANRVYGGNRELAIEEACVRFVARKK